MTTTTSDQPAQQQPAAVARLIDVIVNGERARTPATDLAELIALAGYGEAKIATALNGCFVPARSRGQTQLADGDRIEIVAPRQGG